jgi:NhaP-type Na+/H+ or K+/H+ antiporter
MNEHLLITVMLIAALGMAAQWLAWRLRIPAIILLLATGFSAGPLLGWITPVQTFGPLLEPFVALAVAVILFEGGLNLRLHEYRETGINVNRLASIGLLLTWSASALAGHFVGGLSWPIALVFGAIIVVTGPTVIMPLLKQAKLKRRPAALLKWEGIVNDPLGALLAVLVFEYFAASGHAVAITDIFAGLALALVTAVVGGTVAAYLLGWSFLQGHVPEYLKGPAMLAMVLIIYTLLNQVQEEAGLLAVTVAGVVLANQRLRNIDELRRFKEYITVMLVSALFILLTAQIPLDTLKQLDWRSAALLATVIFVIRPLSVYIATLGTGIDPRERLLTAWIAPRGIVAAAVAGLFAPRLIEEGYGGADQLVPLVFALIVTTVILHGLSIGVLARRLGLAAQHPNGLLIVGASSWAIGLAQTLHKLKVPTIVSDESWYPLRPARMAGIKIHHGEILSERAEETLELNEVSHLLAATNNSAYNALVCTRFAPELGRNHVYQLASATKGESESKEMARTMRGLIAFDKQIRYEDFIRHHYEGWQFHSTRLSDEYGFAELSAELPQQAIPLLMLSENGRLRLFPLDEDEVPTEGDVVISYRPPSSEDQPRDQGGS